MSLGRYLVGVAALVLVLGSVGVRAAAVRRRFLPDWRGAYARLAETVIGCALLVGIMELLGTVGLFTLVPLTATSIASGLVLRFGLQPRSDATADRRRRARPTVMDVVLVLVSVAGVVVVLVPLFGVDDSNHVAYIGQRGRTAHSGPLPLARRGARR